jgi:hypothetical protein
MEERQMESKKRDVLLIVIPAALLFIVFNCFPGKAGNLEPGGPPQPTMITLDQLSTQIEGLSSPIKRVVRGVITFEKMGSVELTKTFSPAIDPNRSVVLLSDTVLLNQESNPGDEWISRCGACLLSLTDTQITVRIEEHAANQKISYQIIEYR